MTVAGEPIQRLLGGHYVLPCAGPALTNCAIIPNGGLIPLSNSLVSSCPVEVEDPYSQRSLYSPDIFL